MLFAQCRLELIILFKQKTAYEMRISDWSSDVCSSDLDPAQMLKERAGIIKTRLQAEIGDIRLEPRRRNGRKRGDGGIIGTRRTLVTSQTGHAPFRKAI